MTEVASEKTPKPAVHPISSQCGGVVGASSAGSLPRNEWQVKNIRRKIKSSSGSLDPRETFCESCHRSSGLRVFLALDRTLENFVRFCLIQFNI